jgi:hypothetical protein
MPDDIRQFETIALIRAYAVQILNEDPLDTQPDTAKRIKALIVRMAQLRCQLDIDREPHPRPAAQMRTGAEIKLPAETNPPPLLSRATPDVRRHF